MGDATRKPEYEWVQCDKCRNWRKIDCGFDSKTLPVEWFCYMEPFYGKCEMSEEKVKTGVITIATEQNGGPTKDPESSPSNLEGSSDDTYIERKVNGVGGRVATSIECKAYVDNIEVRKGDATHKPDHEWVQCDKCRKWRKIDCDLNSETLPLEWFCYMKPFYGKCEMPEEKVKSEVITIYTKQNGGPTKDPESSPSNSEGAGHEWVQCDECRKWRKIDSDLDSKTLPLEWFCSMKPFYGKCEMPEEKVKSEVITTYTKRNGAPTKDPESSPSNSEGAGHEWVQCDECRKWRKIDSDLDSKTLPLECLSMECARWLKVESSLDILNGTGGSTRDPESSPSNSEDTSHDTYIERKANGVDGSVATSIEPQSNVKLEANDGMMSSYKRQCLLGAVGGLGFWTEVSMKNVSCLTNKKNRN